MDKRILLVGFLIALILVSGCIKLDVREAISETGQSDVSMKIDMSAIPTMPGQEVEDPCKQMEEGESPLTSIECTYEDKIVTITGKLDRSDSEALSIKNGTYKLDVKKAWGELTAGSAQAEQMPQDEAAIKQAKAMGIEFNYYVKLPGKMTAQKGGEIQEDGFVKFDLMDLPEGASVESTVSQLDLTTILIIAGIIIVVLVIVLIVLLKRK